MDRIVLAFVVTNVAGMMMKQLDQRLESHYARLSPREKRVADFVFDHFDDLISYNSAELARLSGVSKATVSRLFKRLGYEKYKDMHDELRTLRQSGMPLTDNRDAVQGNTLLARHYKQEMANLTSWTNAIDAQQFTEIIQSLGKSRRVVIIGLRNSYPVAMHLRLQLMQVRSQVSLLPSPGQTLSEELADLSHEDVVVVVGFRRRPSIIRRVLEQLQRQSVPTVLLSEPQVPVLQGLARWQLAAPLESVSAFDSYSAAMSLVNLLSNALLHEMLTEGRQRIHQIADLYLQLDELERR